jgi:hypothetical protein
MTDNKRQKWEDVTLKSLKAELRRLADVKIPEALKARLFAAIPNAKTAVIQHAQVQNHPRAWDFGITAVAAVLIFALMLMVNYGLSVPSQMLKTEFHDTSLYPARLDQNNFLYDQNNTLIGDTDHMRYNGQP